MIGAVPPLQRRWLAVVGVGVPLSAWGSIYPPNTWLQVGPVALIALAAIPALRRWPLSNRAVGCASAFLLIHLFAAHWTYSDVPYDAWSRAVLPGGIDAATGWTRNMFDRLVHFSFGLCLMTPLAEVMRRHGGDTRRRAVAEALLIVLAASALYEIFEWLLAVGMDPADAEAYNGQQGDAFDSSKDMAMATLGATAWIAVAAAGRLRRR